MYKVLARAVSSRTDMKRYMLRINEGRIDRVCSSHDNKQKPTETMKARTAAGIEARECVIVDDDVVAHSPSRAVLRQSRQTAANFTSH